MHMQRVCIGKKNCSSSNGQILSYFHFQQKQNSVPRTDKHQFERVDSESDE